MRKGRKFVALLMTALIIAALEFSALASGYSDVLFDTEPNHATIMGDIYDEGTPFIPDGLDFHSEDDSIWAYRAFDFDVVDETLDIVTGNQFNIDQIWTDGIATVTAEAKHAGLGQSFGWNRGEGVDGLDPNYYELLTDADIGGEPSIIEIAGDFLWGNQPNEDQWWSKNSFNSDGGVDHLVTYFMDGASLNGETVWLLWWEDQPSPGWDQDYQDFVIEVRAVPEPATIVLLGLGGLALLRKRRN